MSTLLEIDCKKLLSSTNLPIGALPPIEIEAIVLLKMTCPSTEEVRVIRVASYIESVYEAITWLNDDAAQT